ncbi:MAG: NAD(P)/FAD-dependent oxidoreductase, partial [Pseudomonadota bacterium]
LDLNAIALGVSPALSLRTEHPTGQEYASHLTAVAAYFQVPVREHVDVVRVEREADGFRIDATDATFHARYVIWAAGEFQYPRRTGFAGSELCLHTAMVGSYDDLDGDDCLIIGGYESGVDAAYNLARRNKVVHLFDAECPWESESADPSVALSPFTLERMRERCFKEQVELHPHTPIASVSFGRDCYELSARDGTRFETRSLPLLAGGFEGSHARVADLFDARADGFPLLNESDESTLAPGLFLCGPSVRHDDQSFCFIYKFRQRFAVVVDAIATSLGRSSEWLETYRLWGMYLDDLSCCGGDCVC